MRNTKLSVASVENAFVALKQKKKTEKENRNISVAGVEKAYVAIKQKRKMRTGETIYNTISMAPALEIPEL